jgi:hypothetical protein
LSYSTPGGIRPVAPGHSRRAWITGGVLAAAILLAWLLWPVTVLEIRQGEDGPLLKEIPVTSGERITYTYVHSIQKRPVDEIMEVGSNDHLVLRETAYDMYGVGLPSDVLDGTPYTDPKDGRFHILNMSRDIPVWLVRVGFVSEQTLEVRGETFRLDSLAPPMTLLEIGVASRARLATLLVSQ